MLRAFRPKTPYQLRAALLGAAAFAAWSVAPRATRAQSAVASSYASRDGRIPSYVLACVSLDGSFTAQPCGVAGAPVHVTVDGGVGGDTPTTAPGTASGQLVGMQGGGAGALPVGVAQSGAWSVTVGNLPAVQPVSAGSLPLPAGAATAANQAAINADGGSQVHVVNLPGTQAVSGAVTVSNLPANQVVTDIATRPNDAAITRTQTHDDQIGALLLPRSANWIDASYAATAAASTPVPAAAFRTGLHVWNTGALTACMNYTVAAAASGSGCAPGSVPIPGGGAYFEDQPGNVSPEAISFVCAGASCPLTIKVR